MCTVTVIPIGERGFRLVTNRDEQRTRAPGLPPERHEMSGERSAVWPIDPAGGGTWVAASNDGLVLAALNLNLDPAPPPPARPRSRGSILTALIESNDAPRALKTLRGFELGAFRPFRLVVVDPEHVMTARWDGQSLAVENREPGPVCLVSSGLGDHLVEPRLGLFEEMVVDGGRSSQDQDAFHRHQWPDRTEISVRMSRLDARTVSVTTVEVADEAVEMGYRDDAGERQPIVLERRPRVESDAADGYGA